MTNPYPSKKIAVFGASEKTDKYGYKIFHTLLQKKFAVYGINPKGGQADGHRFYTSLAEVPAAIDVAIMVIPPVALLDAVKQCKDRGIKEIWFQPGAQSQEAFEAAQQADIHAINGCFMAENGLW